MATNSRGRGRASAYGARSGTRRQTEWISGTINYTDFTAGQSTTLIQFSQAVLRDFVPCTIVRTLGLMSVAFDTEFITNQAYTGALGGCLIREEARAAGVVPDPFEEAGSDFWFLHQFFAGKLDDRTDVDLIVHQNYMVDSKAQRKIVDGDALVFQVQGGGETDGFDVALMLRILLKLH